MSININNLTPQTVSGSNDDTQIKRPSDEPRTETDTGKSSTSDTVSLSEGAVQLGKLENTVANLPVVDTKRVEQIKQAIDNGSFEVDPVKVAEKLMQFESILKPEG